MARYIVMLLASFVVVGVLIVVFIVFLRRLKKIERESWGDNASILSENLPLARKEKPQK